GCCHEDRCDCDAHGLSYLCAPNCGVPIVNAHDEGFCVHGSVGFAPPFPQWPVPQTAATAPPGSRMPSAYFHALDFDFTGADAVAELTRALRCAIERLAVTPPSVAVARITQSPAKMLGVMVGAMAYPSASVRAVAVV